MSAATSPSTPYILSFELVAAASLAMTRQSKLTLFLFGIQLIDADLIDPEKDALIYRSKMPHSSRESERNVDIIVLDSDSLVKIGTPHV